MKNHTIEHCLNAEIEYWFENDNIELSQTDYEYIQQSIKDGYIEGELLQEDHSQGLETSGKIIRGKWKLVKNDN